MVLVYFYWVLNEAPETSLWKQKMKIQIKRLDSQYSDLPLPTYQTPGSAGMDIYAAINEPITIQPQQTVLVPTSLALER